MKIINMHVTIMEFDDEGKVECVKPHGLIIQTPDDEALLDTAVQNMAAQIARHIREQTELEDGE